TGKQAGRHRRGWTVPLRPRRLGRAVGRRQHRHRGRAVRQQFCRGGVGVHPQRRGVDPTGKQAGRQRRGWRRRARHLRRAGRRRQHRYRGLGSRQQFCRSGVGVHPQRPGVDPAGKQAGRQRRGWGRRPGFRVALSGSGNTAIVAGPSDNSAIGAAWVFTRSGGAWTQQGNKLVGTGAGGTGAPPGGSVALSCNTAVVGGFNDNSGVGATWVFVAPTPHDFSGDCQSDIVWYNTASGQVVTWLVNGTSVVGGGSPGSAANPWAIVGQRDFNGDGMSDILWRNSTTGQLLIWFLNGSAVIGGGSPGAAASPWMGAGTGDFNGGGFGDVLWVNSMTGQAVIWLLNGASVIGSGSPGSVPDIYWTLAGTGDFNGDSRSDILWYNTLTGQAVIWLLNGASVIGGGSPGSVPSPPWTVAATGDFNGDGFSDILWLNTSTGQ